MHKLQQQGHKQASRGETIIIIYQAEENFMNMDAIWLFFSWWPLIKIVCGESTRTHGKLSTCQIRTFKLIPTNEILRKNEKKNTSSLMETLMRCI